MNDQYMVYETYGLYLIYSFFIIDACIAFSRAISFSRLSISLSDTVEAWFHVHTVFQRFYQSSLVKQPVYEEMH